MLRSIPFRTTFGRHLALRFLLGTLLILPASAGAEHDLTCHPPDGPGPGPSVVTYTIVNAWPKSTGPALRLTAGITADGTARVLGAIRARDAAGTRLLKAARGGAQTACADTDGDGTAGLTRLAASFRDAKTGARVPVIITSTGDDIDATGVYAVNVRVGKRTMSGEVFVKLPPGQSLGRH